MKTEDIDRDYNLTQIVVSPLYYGMIVNIVLPAALLFGCWWLNNNNQPENIIPEFANTLFYVFAVFSVIQAAAALWWRQRSFDQPMVRREETFEQDISQCLLKRSRPIFVLIASISAWGYLYFFLTGRFRETALFVVLSFVVFQVVRPRIGSVRKLIIHQKELVEQGRFLNDGSSLT